MTGLQIDTDASRRSARTWSGWADQITTAQLAVDGDIERLSLARAAWACSRMAAAATELWTLSGFLAMLADRLEAIDAGAALFHDTAIDELMWLAGGMHGSASACPASSYSGAVGERGDTYRAELRTPYELDAESPSELGRQLVMRALQDTATPGRTRKDEFELVRLTDGRYLVALPGVIDLTHPGLGHDGDNGSVRDLDQSALRSSFGSSVAGNAYARMVWEALVTHGVPFGSQLVIVGHSFGADTALDLASDPAFNGPHGFDVTHVVAAGYDTQQQLNDIPETTRVLALRNRNDVPVLAEAAAHVVTQPFEDAREIVDGVARLDAGEVAGGLFGAVWHPLKAATPVLQAATHADDVVAELGDGDLFGAAEDAVLPIANTQRHGDSQVDVVFDGGWGRDFGHDQDRYIDFLAEAGDPLVIGFLGSLATGTAVAGLALAVDVSVPEKKHDAQKT